MHKLAIMSIIAYSSWPTNINLWQISQSQHLHYLQIG